MRNAVAIGTTSGQLDANDSTLLNTGLLNAKKCDSSCCAQKRFCEAVPPMA